jgi:predicted acyl esterase
MSMHIRTSFSHETTHEDLWIPLPDGTRLHARVWRPLTDAPVPALLEYLPDRLTDRTAPRDRQRHPWYAGHGYASVRVVPAVTAIRRACRRTRTARASGPTGWK